VFINALGECIYCPLKITHHTAIIVKIAGNKSEYTPVSDNSCASFIHAKPHVLFILLMFCLLDRTIQIFVSCIRAAEICALSTILS